MKGISSSVIRCFIKIKTHLNQRVCHLPRQGKANFSDSSVDRGVVLLNRLFCGEKMKPIFRSSPTLSASSKNSLHFLLTPQVFRRLRTAGVPTSAEVGEGLRAPSTCANF